MFWLDRIFGDIEVQLKDKIASGKTLLVRDEKTASGRVHVGSMRALVLHAAIAERLGEAGIPHEFKYEMNDMDHMDGLPAYLDKAVYEKEMGKPLYAIPVPEVISGFSVQADGATNFAEFFANEYRAAILKAGFKPEFYYASELYRSGKMNEAIRLALDKAEVVRRIYKEVSGAERKDDWFPLLTMCEQCGKSGTTRVVAWDGEKVTYRCLPKAVEWAVGCGHEAHVSPFDGRAKFPWKIDWPAKWFVLGVDIEGGGKDHYSKGGARDVAKRISEEVFNYPEPFGVANEFFLIGGKKMSSSKGAGASAKDIVALVPQHIFRLALFGKDVNQQINFDPEGDTIPLLYDQYDKLAEGYKTNQTDDYARLFQYLHAASERPGLLKAVERFLPRFSQVAFLAQMPHMDFFEEIAKLKHAEKREDGGELTEADRAEATERREYAQKWLDAYAPEKFVFKLQTELPEATRALSTIQKKALSALADCLKVEPAPQMPSGEALHHKLHEIKESEEIAPGELFSAIYLTFLGKSFGPKAGWFLSVLEKDFVIKRLQEASA
ncbi:MAG: lysine--tRNA ligase [bacterium]